MSCLALVCLLFQLKIHYQHWCRFVYLWGGTCPPNAQICPPNVRCAPPKISRAFLIPASYFAFASGYAIAQTLLYKNIICLFHFIDPLLMIKWISLFQFGSTDRIFFAQWTPPWCPGAPQAQQGHHRLASSTMHCRSSRGITGLSGAPQACQGPGASQSFQGHHRPVKSTRGIAGAPQACQGYRGPRPVGGHFRLVRGTKILSGPRDTSGPSVPL